MTDEMHYVPAVGDGDGRSGDAGEAEYLPGTQWRVWHAVVVTFFFVFSAVIGVVILAAFTGRGFDDFTANEQLGVLGPIQFIGGLVTLYVLMRIHQFRGPRKAYGLEIKPREWWAFVAGIGLQIGAAVIIAILTFVFFQNSDPPQQAAAELATDLDSWGIALGIVAIVFLAPVYEEIVFRGMILSRLLRLMDAWPAYLLNGFLFAGLHVLFDPNAWFASIALFPLGTALAWMAHRGGGLSRPILAHMGVNALGAIGLFFADDLERIVEDLEETVEAAAHLLGLG